MGETLEALSRELEVVIRDGGPRDDAAFDEFVRRIHDWQCEHVDPLARLARAKDRGVGKVTSWHELPAAPAAAWKRFDLYGGPPPARVFKSSGTTSGVDQVCQAPYSELGLALMDAAISVNARRMLFPDETPTRILVLAPPPIAAPHMIMAYGMQRLIDEFGVPGSRFLLGPGGLDPAGILGELSRATHERVPVTLIGASFGFVPLLDGLAEKGVRIELPAGSRTMDAGGFKGRSREVTRVQMQEAIAARLGVPPPWSVNLLGMTELPSQLYDDGIAALHEGRVSFAGKRNPPWTRTAALDPVTLDPAPHGATGILLHVDLANIERPLAVLTDDVGVTHDDGSFTILGRAHGAEARGCSLSVEEWQRAQGAS